MIFPGIYLTEFRHMPHSRRVVATILFVHPLDPVEQTLIICNISVLES